MDKKVLAAAGIIVVLIGGGLAFTLAGGGDEAGQTVAAQQVTSTESSAGAGQSTGQGNANGGGAGEVSKAAGQYVDYSPELVASTPGEKLLFFHASWCPSCIALEEDINAAGLPDGVTVFKVDYDSNQELRDKYGVTIQTTIVKVDDQGEMIDSFVPYDDPTVANVEQALLN